MFRKIINLILFLPFSLCLTYQKAIFSETNNYFDKLDQEEDNKTFINYNEIDTFILNNAELQSLKESVISESFNLSSKISQKYPNIDLQANGLPKYVFGRNFNSNLASTKTSQFSANPSMNIRWDVIAPLRGSEIKIARNQYKIALNNYEIKRKDLIQEAKSRYHKYQKSYQEIKNKKYSLDSSITSLENAQTKLDSGIGTKFDVLEADAQLSRDKQSLNETKIEHQINKIALNEILNLNKGFEINKEQKIIGFWNHKLKKNIKNGLENNISLKNIALQKLIKKNQAESFLNTNRPNIYISNTLSTAFTKGDSLSTSIDSSEYGSAYTNTISLNFSWNIFDGGKNNNAYKASKAQARGEEYSQNNFKNILKTNIHKSYLNLKLHEEKILSSLKDISSTNEALRLARLRYDVGISTLKDVLVRQKELSNAQSKKINAIYNYNMSLDELERLTFLKISNNCLDDDNYTESKKDHICNTLK